MKYLACLLSIYLLALNLVPCEDYSVYGNEANTEVSQNLDSDHQHQGADVCSPFCICQCCHISATHFKIADIKIDMAYLSNQDFFYLNELEKDFSFSVLQPPQV